MSFSTAGYQNIPGKRVSKMAQRKKLARAIAQVQGRTGSRTAERFKANAFTLPAVKTRVAFDGTATAVYQQSRGPRRERNGRVTTTQATTPAILAAPTHFEHIAFRSDRSNRMLPDRASAPCRECAHGDRPHKG